MEVNISIDDIYSIVHTKDRNVLTVLKTTCRARQPGFQFMKAYKKGTWNGYTSLLHNSTEFPTGLLGLVAARLRKKGYKLNITYKHSIIDIHALDPDCLEGVTLRDYQVEAALSLMNAGRGIAKMATNAGKTEVMATIIYNIDGKHVVLVSRKELLYQTATRLQNRLSEPVGIIGDGKFSKERVTVAMVQTLSKKTPDELKKQFRGNVGLHVDECHHSSSDTYMQLLENIPGRYRYGYSGTPLTYQELNDLRLIGATGRVLVDISNEYLIDEGYSAPATINIISIFDDKEEYWDMPYQDAYKKLLAENKNRNKVIATVAKKHKSDTVLIIVRYIKHGKLLEELIPGSVFVNGGDTTEHRRQVLEAMQTEPGIYIATNIFDEGIDVPAISVLIMAAGGKAERSVLQRIGRGLRKKEDNQPLIVYDFMDDTNKYLLAHSEERINVYVSEGFHIELDSD